MGCGGDREKGNVALEEKWDYVVSVCCSVHIEAIQKIATGLLLT